MNNNTNNNFPEIIPIFPLKGVVMFPDTYLPLNIFEPRYLEMINKAISSKSRLVGMIQPNNSNHNNFCDVGCAGKIVKFEETTDKRYLITLKGLSRFELISEKTNRKNFKEAQVKWDRYREDLQKKDIKEKFTNLKASLKEYFKIKNIKVNLFNPGKHSLKNKSKSMFISSNNIKNYNEGDFIKDTELSEMSLE